MLPERTRLPLDHVEYIRRRRANFTPAEREKEREQNRKSWANNREKYAAKKRARHAARSPLARRADWIRWTYRVSEDEAIRLAAITTCGVCGRGPGARALHVDHCHTTGVVRGVLCHRCNLALGLLREDASVLRKLAEYLEPCPR
jgi:hypothetical protein